jgi:hypothetical protein
LTCAADTFTFADENCFIEYFFPATTRMCLSASRFPFKENIDNATVPLIEGVKIK